MIIEDVFDYNLSKEYAEFIKPKVLLFTNHLIRHCSLYEDFVSYSYVVCMYVVGYHSNSFIHLLFIYVFVKSIGIYYWFQEFVYNLLFIFK